MSDIVLSVDRLTHRYGTRTVLDEVSFQASAGEVVAVIGPSGAGKTTLFRGITRLVRAAEGDVTVAGHQLSSLSGGELRRARREVALIFQQFNLVRRLSALDNVIAGQLAELPTWRVLLRRPGPAARAHATACLDEVGLAEYAGVRADRLSGGQQQRVAIARALAQRSRVILADEPVSSLDPASAAGVLSALRSVAHDEGIAVVCNLHQVELIDGFADRVIGLRSGRIVVDVTTSAFRGHHRDLVYGTPPSPPPRDRTVVNHWADPALQRGKASHEHHTTA
jgi:phosphonate transport system ATP-binding protein